SSDLFLGASLGIKNNSMAAITMLIDSLPKKILKIIQILIQLLTITFALFITNFGMKWLMSPSTMTAISPSAQLPMWIPYMVLPLVMFLIIIFSIDNIVNVIRSFNTEKRSATNEKQMAKVEGSTS